MLQKYNKNNRFMLSAKEFINFLKKKNYNFVLHEHAALFTVENSRALRGKIKGAHSKNLFLKNKKNNFYMISCEENTKIDLKRTSKSLGLGNLSFAKEGYLDSLLGIKPGSVSPFALLNDIKNDVDFYLDEKLYKSEFINFHPLINTATITIGVQSFINFMIENNKKIHIFSTADGLIIKKI